MKYAVGLLFGLLVVTANALCQTNKKMDPNKEYFEQVSAAAHKGDFKAQVCLGQLYAAGMGTQRDYKRAFQWYKKAADSGYPQGKEAVARMYRSGLGVKPNPKTALSMFHDLVDHGYMPAATDIGDIYMDSGWGAGGGRRDYKKALLWFSKAAQADDSYAEARIGEMYQWGLGVKRDHVKAMEWLTKASHHVVGCVPNFMNLNFLIFDGNLELQKKKRGMNVNGTLKIRYVYHDGRATQVTVISSSGSREFDQAWINALRISQLPPWPNAYHTYDKTLGFWLTKNPFVVNEGFGASLRAAIKSAVVMPLQVLIHGSKGTDIATVAFDYLNGRVSHVRLVKSSGDKYEDAAAIVAVKDAHFSKTPEEYLNQKIHFTVPINFKLDPQPSVSPGSPTHAISPLSGQLTTPPVVKTTGTGLSMVIAETDSTVTVQTHTSSRSYPTVDQSEKQSTINNSAPIKILSTSWSDPNYVRPLRMEVSFKNISGEVIDAVTLYVYRCGVKGSSITIPYPLVLRGTFKPDTTYDIKPSFPAGYTEFTGNWSNIQGGQYSTHMLITKITIDYANGGIGMYAADVYKLLSKGISNFCSTGYQ
ncbi:MAG: TonB family protein [Gammaproteobacteria bacterium]